MSGTLDIAKGRIMEAAGVIADSDRLRKKGLKTQKVGEVKKAAEKAIDNAADHSAQKANKKKDK